MRARKMSTASKDANALENYWEILGLEPGASTTDVQKAYRKKSLAVHPDRYKGDNPEWATEEFLRLTRAKEVLEDDKARAAFEALQKARAAHREKQEQQNAGRKKLREDLEAREEAARKRQRTSTEAAEAAREAAQQEQTEKAARAELQRELERLRRTGRLGGQPQQPTPPRPSAPAEAAAAAPRAKISLRWSADSPMTTDVLQRLLVDLGAPSDVALAVVGTKAVAEVPVEAANALSKRSVELSARGVKLNVQLPESNGAAASGSAASNGGGGGASLPVGWREQRTPDGKVYYYHVATRQTQWKLPTAADGGGAAATNQRGAAAGSLEDLESATLERLKQASEKQRKEKEAAAAASGSSAG